GGLETGAKPSQFAVVERSPMYRLRRYFADRAPAPAVDDRPVILLVPPMMVDANVFDVTETNGAVSVLHRAGLDPWVI
ncbi:hypothetical protein PJN25_29995, partial [Mycobacterium kansasii]